MSEPIRQNVSDHGNANSFSAPIPENAPSGYEPFPALTETPSPSSPQSPNANSEAGGTRSRGQSSTLSRIRRASQAFEESDPPTGMWIASSQIASKVPSISEIRRGTFGSDGWSTEGQVQESRRRTSSGRRRSLQTTEHVQSSRRDSVGVNSSENVPQGGGETMHESFAETIEEGEHSHGPFAQGAADSTASNTVSNTGPQNGLHNHTAPPRDVSSSSDTKRVAKSGDEYKTTPFDNGYQFPPKHTWKETTAIFFKASWKFFLTPIGFLVIVYGLNVVAWGGMLFLLLCNASPAMCHPTCNDINSPRRIWIETTCQIVNALFCVTGFGTIPWRFRDLYYLLLFRIGKDEMGLRRLAGINRGWFRLAGSQELPVELGPAQIKAEGSSNVPHSCVPFPLAKIPDAPLTGVRAPPTAMWKLDFVIWTMVWNTFLQVVLSGLMWGMNRYNRPSWSTGLFVALACIVAGCGGIMTFMESKKVKAIEGVPISEEDQEKLRHDKELGIVHFNNINDEEPKEPKKPKKKVVHAMMDKSTSNLDDRHL